MIITEYFEKFIEPKSNIEESRKLFSNTDLRKLIIPLVIEQMLAMMVGVVDTMMISHVGESAVSGVSLVDMISSFFIFVFSALATGGAVVVSQYIGSKNKKDTRTAASQLIMITTLISLVLMTFALIFNKQILHLLFGKIDKDVMTVSKTYFSIDAISFPCLALYNACAALFRSMSKSKVTMTVSMSMNVLHVIGNTLVIFVLHAGVAGVATSTLLCRAYAAIVLFYLIRNKSNVVTISIKEIFSWQLAFITKILKIAVPNGIENGLFQLSKIVLISIIARFGTQQIAANGVANSIDYVAAMIVTGMSLAVVTVVGQSIGAKDYELAIYYIKKLIRICYATSTILDLAIIAAMPLILKLYSLTPETCRYIYILVIIHNLCIITIYPFSGPLSNAMRASGDVRYTMSVAVFATVICRVAFSIVLGVWLNLGIVGIWLAMGLDWGIRAILFRRRFSSGKWQHFRVI